MQRKTSQDVYGMNQVKGDGNVGSGDSNQDKEK